MNANQIAVGDKVRSTKMCRMVRNEVNPTVKVVEIGRKWRHYDAVVGVKRVIDARTGEWNFNGKRHIYLVKNLVAV